MVDEDARGPRENISDANRHLALSIIDEMMSVGRERILETSPDDLPEAFERYSLNLQVGREQTRDQGY